MANKERISGESTANIRVGPAGWSYSDWDGTVYPPNRPQGFHEAAYLAQYFSVIEIDASFERALRPEVSRVWVQKLARYKNFEFTAKLYRGFTQDQNLDPAALRRFSQGLEPLIDNGLLGCVLAQFPASFRLTAENLAYVGRLARALPQYPLVAEFRNASWNNSRALSVLADLGVGFCNIDQPQQSQSMPPTEHVTSPIGYVRLEGRNYHPGACGDHFYSSDQLSRWLPRIEKVAQSGQKTYVVTGNRLAGQSVANALEIESMISRQRIAVPPAVLDCYPRLQRIALNQPVQRSYFFDAVKETRSAWPGWTPLRPLAAGARA
jgi:uncharacterized protein YecE (DUF72 family)